MYMVCLIIFFVYHEKMLCKLYLSYTCLPELFITEWQTKGVKEIFWTASNVNTANHRTDKKPIWVTFQRKMNTKERCRWWSVMISRFSNLSIVRPPLCRAHCFVTPQIKTLNLTFYLNQEHSVTLPEHQFYGWWLIFLMA